VGAERERGDNTCFILRNSPFLRGMYPIIPPISMSLGSCIQKKKTKKDYGLSMYMFSYKTAVPQLWNTS